MEEITFKVTDGDILCQDISSDDELSIYYYNDEVIWNNMKKTLGYGESQQGDKAFESLVQSISDLSEIISDPKNLYTLDENEQFIQIMKNLSNRKNFPTVTHESNQNNQTKIEVSSSSQSNSEKIIYEYEKKAVASGTFNNIHLGTNNNTGKEIVIKIPILPDNQQPKVYEYSIHIINSLLEAWTHAWLQNIHPIVSKCIPNMLGIFRKFNPNNTVNQTVIDEYDDKDGLWFIEYLSDTYFVEIESIFDGKDIVKKGIKELKDMGLENIKEFLEKQLKTYWDDSMDEYNKCVDTLINTKFSKQLKNYSYDDKEYIKHQLNLIKFIYSFLEWVTIKKTRKIDNYFDIYTIIDRLDGDLWKLLSYIKIRDLDLDDERKLDPEMLKNDMVHDYNLMLQIMIKLYTLIKYCKYNHRDFHCGNVMYKNTDEKFKFTYITKNDSETKEYTEYDISCGKNLFVIDFGYSCFDNTRVELERYPQKIHQNFNLYEEDIDPDDEDEDYKSDESSSDSEQSESHSRSYSTSSSDNNSYNSYYKKVCCSVARDAGLFLYIIASSEIDEGHYSKFLQTWAYDYYHTYAPTIYKKIKTNNEHSNDPGHWHGAYHVFDRLASIPGDLEDELNSLSPMNIIKDLVNRRFDIVFNGVEPSVLDTSVDINLAYPDQNSYSNNSNLSNLSQLDDLIYSYN